MRDLTCLPHLDGAGKAVAGQWRPFLLGIFFKFREIGGGGGKKKEEGILGLIFERRALKTAQLARTRGNVELSM
jgi:hypothetical protein